MGNKLYYLNNIRIAQIKRCSLKSTLENILFSNKLLTQIITLNTDFLRISYKDSNFHNICKRSYLTCADGIGIVLLLWLHYREIFPRITGTDLFEECFRIANEHQLRIALVGASETTLSILSQKVYSKWPSVKIKTISPKFEFERDSTLNNSIVNELKDFEPDILFVALGCPRQEKWINANKDYIRAKINIGVGAVFDFYAGTRRRAPIMFQKLGLEWFWRLIHEPIGLGKRYLYLDLPFFVKTVFKLLVKKGSV